MKKSTLAKVSAIIVTVILLTILFTQINLSDVINTLLKINPVYLLVGFLLYTASYFFRALRFYILLNHDVCMRDLFQIVCLHNMMNYVLPARTGELSYVYLLKKTNGRATGEGIATLVVARIFDFIIIVILFLISVFLVNNVPSYVVDLILIIASFMLVLVILLGLMLYYGQKSLNLLNYIMGVFHITQSNFGEYIFNKCKETVDCLENLRSSKKIYLKLFLCSLGIWLMLYSMNYSLIVAMGISIGFITVIFASTFAVFTTVLPIQGVGGFGTLEAGWTIGFVAAGLSTDIAISSGFSYHIVILLYAFVFGVFGLLRLKNIYI